MLYNWGLYLLIPFIYLSNPPPHPSLLSGNHLFVLCIYESVFVLFCFLFLKLFCSLINLFIYFWLHWVFVAARGLSLVAASGGYFSLRCACFSLWWLLLLRSTGSRCAGFSSCGTWALLLRSMWDLRGPGFEPVSPALAGGFLTTAPPGKSLFCFLDSTYN